MEGDRSDRDGDQNVSGLGDARIGEHPLHGPLRDGDDVPDRLRRDREDREGGDPVDLDVQQADQEDAEQGDDPDVLGGRGQENADRRRRALIHIGRPHVERHDRDLEPETRDQQHQGDDERRFDVRVSGQGEARRSSEEQQVRRGPDRRRPRDAVDQGDAEQDDPRAHGADDEELH